MFPAESEPQPSPWQLKHRVCKNTKKKKKRKSGESVRLPLSRVIGSNVSSRLTLQDFLASKPKEKKKKKTTKKSVDVPYPAFPVAFLAEEAPSSPAPVAGLDRGRVGHLEDLHLGAEEVRGLRGDVPRAGSRPAPGAVNLPSAVRHERPGRLPLLRKRLDLVLHPRPEEKKNKNSI